MISPKPLLTDLQKWVTKFENDLRQRCQEVPELDTSLRADWQKARDSKRTAEAYETWRDGQLTQSAVGWVLGCVFVRFLEDNLLLDKPWIAGTGDRRIEAEHMKDSYFQQHPTLSDRDYLHHVFTEVGKLPGMADLFDRRHNALWRAGISGDAAAGFIAFWRKMDHDFTDPDWGTRFLGDLYQDLSEYAKKTFALLQTPEFIEEFILDRTLDPAIERFGYEQVRMIDPTCGSGHFILGGFKRLLIHWQNGHPEMNEREIVKHALAGVAGVDLNPFAIAIARFRLLLEAWKACAVTRLRAAPDFRLNLAVGDSLLHGPVPGELTSPEALLLRIESSNSTYSVESAEELARILGLHYHAVIGNPPYITVKDKALSAAYRDMFGSCHRQYSLSVPFMERFFGLAIKGEGSPQHLAGFVGQITANSFCKAEFGKRIVEEFIPKWDVTHVIDTRGAELPGHGTPTLIIFGRNREPATEVIRSVKGIRSEPEKPSNPAEGLVWRSICALLDHPGKSSEYVSCEDSPRTQFHSHPWSIGGGGTTELKSIIEQRAGTILRTKIIPPIGRAVRVGEEQALIFNPAHARRTGVPVAQFRGYLEGEFIRDWNCRRELLVWYPYAPESHNSAMLRKLWPWKTTLLNRATFQGNMEDAGRRWFEFMQHTSSAYRTPLSIAFAFVASHNHFVLDRGGQVFKQTAPVIKLGASSTEAEHITLLGVLNSSAACFWARDTFFPRGGFSEGKWEERMNWNGTPMEKLPIPAMQPSEIPAALVKTSTFVQSQSASATLMSWNGSPTGTGLLERLANARNLTNRHRGHLIWGQEELDWQIYEAFGLVDRSDGVSLPEGDAIDSVYDVELKLGQRAFEIVMARKMASGELQTTWFEHHCSIPITELPSYWSSQYRELVENRIRRIETDSNIRLIEQPEYKRRWKTESWEKQVQQAIRQWLLARLETAFFEGERIAEDGPNTVPTTLRNSFASGRGPALCTTRQLADVVSHDPAFMEAAAVYRDNGTFDLPKLVQELVTDESVPFLPIRRYKDSGLRKRIVWERTWQLQRQEDQIEAEVRKENADKGLTEVELKPLVKARQKERVGDISVPPVYAKADFKKSHWWNLRDKLDVPKERWITYSGTETPSVIAWAGWNYKQQVKALADYYQERKDQDGWSNERLAPLLAGLKDLLPWLKQWHSDLDSEYQVYLGEFYEQFLRDQIHSLGMNEAQIEELRIGSR